MYEIVPGFIFSSIAILVFSLLSKEPSQEIQDEFEQAKRPLPNE
jgi:sodium/proline symporter